MFYLINNDSLLSLADQIAQCNTFHNIANATRAADRMKAKTGDNYEIIKISSVYTTQTLDEAMANMESADQ